MSFSQSLPQLRGSKKKRIICGVDIEKDEADMTEKERSERAMELFSQGYNCAQAVLLSFADEAGADTELLAKMASSFGGGIGGMREVCGCVSGMCMAAGMLFGYSDPEARETKKEHYALVRSLADEFARETGSVICRELLAGEKLSANPRPRTEEYYRKRPCREFTGIAAAILQRRVDETR